MKYLFSIIAFSIIGFSTLKAQNALPPKRVVFWLHGLGGDDGAWTRASTATTFGAPSFPQRPIYSVQLGYSNQQYGLNEAANYLVPFIESNALTAKNVYNIDRSQNFMIAHSQGGLVGRSLDRLYTVAPGFLRNINGLVTFGTPHQGARILNNVGAFPEFVDVACTSLMSGPINEAVTQNFWISLIITDKVVKKVLDPLCYSLSVASPLFFSQFNTPISKEFEVNAPVLNALNAFPSNIHKVAFYGIEDQNTAVWRVLYNVLKSKPNDFPAFGADDDSELLNKAIENTLKYQAKVNSWTTTFNNNPPCEWWSWITGTTFCLNSSHLREVARRNRDAWQEGVNWWLSANDRFRLITGAKSYSSLTTTGYECNCDEYDYDGQVILNSWTTEVTDPNDCRGNTWLQSCNLGNQTSVTTWSENNNPSDGVVLKESAENFPGCQFTAAMPGSNHQQMRNDSNTRERLKELFNGSYDSYFITQ